MAAPDTGAPDPRRVEKLGILDEAVASLGERKGRTVLTALGTVLGVGVLVAVLGLTTTARSQIDSRFTALSATEVTISQVNDPVATRSMAFPEDFEQRATKLHGAVDAGLSWKLPPEIAKIRTSPIPQADPVGTGAEVLAASPGALRVAGAHASTGRVYDDFTQTARARVAIIGPVVAGDLGITDLDGHPTLSIGGVTFTIIGILDTVDRHTELLNNIIIPTATARSIWGDPTSSGPPSGWVSVDKGAGEVVADQLASATSTTHPEKFEVIAPPDPRQLRGSINSDLQTLFLLLAVVCLIVGMVGIANTTFVTVMERLGEIGLRRALGARKMHIAAQFLAEATVIGIVGGLLGALLGLGIVVGTALAQGWTAVLPPLVIMLGPAIGAITALIAALYPALRGAATEPVVALRLGAN